MWSSEIESQDSQAIDLEDTDGGATADGDGGYKAELLPPELRIVHLAFELFYSSLYIAQICIHWLYVVKVIRFSIQQGFKET